MSLREWYVKGDMKEGAMWHKFVPKPSSDFALVERAAYDRALAQAVKLRDALGAINCHAEDRGDDYGTKAMEAFDAWLDEEGG